MEIVNHVDLWEGAKMVDNGFGDSPIVKGTFKITSPLIQFADE